MMRRPQRIKYIYRKAFKSFNMTFNHWQGLTLFVYRAIGDPSSTAREFQAIINKLLETTHERMVICIESFIGAILEFAMAFAVAERDLEQPCQLNYLLKVKGEITYCINNICIPDFVRNLFFIPDKHAENISCTDLSIKILQQAYCFRKFDIFVAYVLNTFFKELRIYNIAKSLFRIIPYGCSTPARNGAIIVYSISFKPNAEALA